MKNSQNEIIVDVNLIDIILPTEQLEEIDELVNIQGNVVIPDIR